MRQHFWTMNEKQEMVCDFCKVNATDTPEQDSFNKVLHSECIPLPAQTTQPDVVKHFGEIYLAGLVANAPEAKLISGKTVVIFSIAHKNFRGASDFWNIEHWSDSDEDSPLRQLLLSSVLKGTKVMMKGYPLLVSNKASYPTIVVSNLFTVSK